MTDDAPELSILILSWNTRELTLACLDALGKNAPSCAHEVLVLDNGSSDGSADAIATQYPDCRLLRSPENLGYAIGNNRLAEAAKGRYLCLLNSDTEVEAGALDQLRQWLEQHPEYGAASPMLVSEDGSVQRSCKRIPGLWMALVYDLWWRRLPILKRIDDRYFYRDFDHLSSRDIEQPPGACFLISRELWEGLGGFDPELWLFYNDVDLCRRLLARGLRIRYIAEARVLHHEGASTKNFAAMVPLWGRNRISYYRKHYGACGRLWIRMLLRLRAFEEWFRIGRRHRVAEDRKAARAELRSVLREVLADS